MIWIALFGIQESLESSQESRNPAKIPKDSESRRRKFIVSDPSNNNGSIKGKMSIDLNKH